MIILLFYLFKKKKKAKEITESSNIYIKKYLGTGQIVTHLKKIPFGLIPLRCVFRHVALIHRLSNSNSFPQFPSFPLYLIMKLLQSNI